jgi:hypothetical protein
MADKGSGNNSNALVGRDIVVEHFDVMNQRGEVVLVADHLLLVDRSNTRT